MVEVYVANAWPDWVPSFIAHPHRPDPVVTIGADGELGYSLAGFDGRLSLHWKDAARSSSFESRCGWA